MGQKKVVKNPKAAKRAEMLGGDADNKKKVHAKDVKIQQFGVTLYGKRLVEDTQLELTYGRRYGLLGLNGSGKSTILSAIRAREGVPIPEWINIYHVHSEAPPSDNSALDAVISVVRDEQLRLEAL